MNVVEDMLQNKTVALMSVALIFFVYRLLCLLVHLRPVFTLRGPALRQLIAAQAGIIQVVENFGPDLPLLFKLHEIWSVDSQENH